MRGIMTHEEALSDPTRPRDIPPRRWMNMRRGEREQATRNAGIRASKTREQVEHEQFTAALIQAGGNLWTKGDNKRIYFNEVYVDKNYVDGYYDVHAKRWTIVLATPKKPLLMDFVAAVMADVAVYNYQTFPDFGRMK